MTTPRRITADELNAALNMVKGEFPKDAVCALFVFQPATDQTGRSRVSVDFVSNADTRSLAYTLRDWARDLINGLIPIEKHPNAGRLN